MKSLYLALPRPQYVSLPEGYITALASKAFEVEYPVDSEGLRLAVTYQSDVPGTKKKTVLTHQTMPTGPALDAFADALQAEGLRTDGDRRALGHAVAGGLGGVRPKSGKGRAAIPLSPALALAQNLPGLVGTHNPPDLGGILETFFSMGAPAGLHDSRGATTYWVEATQHRREIDALVRTVDAAAEQSFFAAGVRAKQAPELQDGRALEDFRGTPFDWFYQTWTKLCRSDWVEALPARVWVDWANTVLRLAYGFGYLWEVAWYEVLLRAVVSGGTESPDELKRNVGELLPWKDEAATVSVRDIAAATKWRARRSNAIRDEIRDWIHARPELTTAESQLDAMRQDLSFREVLTEASVDAAGANENLWEAIRYSLQTRDGVGQDADHYGFIRKKGSRYSVPDPGVEWIAALSSLTCEYPGGLSDVGRLLANLRLLGLRPELGELVGRLEAAGVARGSADADQAVEIQSAF